LELLTQLPLVRVEQAQLVDHQTEATPYFLLSPQTAVVRAAHSLQTELVTLVVQVVAVEQAQVELQTKEAPVVQPVMEMLVRHIAQAPI
jgi:HPt (histidine-containing phosphotransfer) domain-containing protein